MIKYYKVVVNQTARAINNKQEEYQSFNQEKEEYGTIKEIKDWLKERYGDCKKEKMYQDRKDGTSYQSGWIYSFINKDWSHNSEKWYQRDWVSIYEIKSKSVLV